MLFGNISFDVAAILILLMILVWYCIEKRVPLRSYKVYVLMVVVVIIASSMEILTECTAKNGYENNAFLISLSLMVMALHSTTLMILWYVATLVNVSINKYYFSFAFMVTFIITLTNPITKFCIEYSTNGYVFHWGSNILFLLDIVNVFASLVISRKLIKEITRVRYYVLIISIFLCWVGLFIQILWKQNMMVILMAIACLSLYQYLLNPSTMTDNITGLFSRKFMNIYVKNLFNEKKTFEIVIISMDDFKFINKTYGFNTGDELLKLLGDYIGQIQTGNILFRMELDRFCVIINKENDIIELTKKLEERFTKSWNTSKHEGIRMSASMCCISCPQDATNYEELIEIIDYSVAAIKETNKGHVSNTKNLELDKLHKEKAIENIVKQALDNDKIMVYYQPIFSIESGKYNSAEALVRLHTEENGWISPEVFVPIAEKNGLINKMGEMVLDKVCKFVHDNDLKSTAIEYIEVNISTIQIAQDNFVDMVKHILEKYGVKPSQINMEITETASIESHKVILENITRLIDYGIKFSLDDYGSGNANIDYINQMPFSIIKLDKDIIWDAFESEKAKIILEYTIAMLKALELFIVAEGVETEEMKTWLSEKGCDYMQGWLYSKAVSDIDFMKKIQ